MIVIGIAFEIPRSMAISTCIPVFCYLVVPGYAFWESQFAPSRSLPEAF
jgi:uncharacterized protein YqhQ